MPSPFPGMDPYLEHPISWPSLHHQLITWIAYEIAPAVDPNYFVAVEERVTVTSPEEHGNGHRYGKFMIPEVADSETGPPAAVRSGSTVTLALPLRVSVPALQVVREPYLEMQDMRRGREVVTVIEVLSPTNKRPGDGRSEYLAKRHTVLSSSANFVEIDLLRAGARMPVLDAPISYNYSVLVSRVEERSSADFYPFTVRDPFPIFPIPLRPGEPEPAVHLRNVLDEAYERGLLHRTAEYDRLPDPPLSPEDQAWAESLIAEWLPESQRLR